MGLKEIADVGWGDETYVQTANLIIWPRHPNILANVGKRGDVRKGFVKEGETPGISSCTSAVSNLAE